MGGCRCTFRQCATNSANSPGTHFFHFPHKDMPRCELWAKYSGNITFLHLKFSKLRNKVVCENHFRDECFMNYKKDRLVQKAVPTLVRLSNGSVLDYEESETPTPKIITGEKPQHLIPPASHESVTFNAAEICSEIFTVQTVDEDELLQDIAPEPVSKPPPLKRMKSAAPRILNVSAPQNSVTWARNFESPVQQKVIIEYHEDSAEQIEFESIASESDDVGEAEQFVSKIIIDQAHTEVVEKSLYLEKEAKHAMEIEEFKRQLAESESLIASKDAEIAQKQAEIAEKEAEIAKQQAKAAAVVINQVETITTSHKSEPSAGVSAPLTKAQLYNGIKKYLSPSMASIVRMEMFGGPEREWKPDEKSVSVELLLLGDQVFDFIRDEWRCRLPPKREVQQWLSDTNNVVEDEDL